MSMNAFMIKINTKKIKTHFTAEPAKTFVLSFLNHKKELVLIWLLSNKNNVIMKYQLDYEYILLSLSVGKLTVLSKKADQL